MNDRYRPYPDPNQNRVSAFASLFFRFATPILDRTSSSKSSSTWSEGASSSDYSRSSSATSRTSDYVPEPSEMKKVFELFDGNKDGKICCQDLHRYMERMGIDMSEQEAKSMIRSVDSDCDGCVDFDEFYALYKSLNDEVDGMDMGEEEHDPLADVFKVFDKNGDGVITAEELHQVLKALGIPEGRSLKDCRKMIQRVDSNGDEVIDLQEFKLMMSANCFQGL